MRQSLFVIGVCASVLAGASAAAGQWLDYPTPGIPRTADGKPDLSAPVPRAVDGKPDLSGLWGAECLALSACWTKSRFFDIATGLPEADVEMTSWAAAIQKQRETRDHIDDPNGYCLPAGYPRMAFVNPFKIIQTPGLIAVLHESLPAPMFRQVFTDGRALPLNPEPSWLGHSVGRWEGETLVMETTGFPDRGWLDTRKARPHSDALHLTERFRRVDFGHIDWQLTIDDPKAFKRSWTTRITLTFLADTELLQGFCDSHHKTMEHRRIEPAPPEPPSPPLSR